VAGVSGPGRRRPPVAGETRTWEEGNRPDELPLGILTALLGAPFYLWLLRRHKGLDAA
jgi:hypothetical protein